MALSLVDADILLLLVVALNSVVLSRNSSQDDVFVNDQAVSGNDVQKECYNWQGMLVADGEKYVPHINDMCTQCTCDKGFPIMCLSVACSPPLQCSSPQQVKESCCDFICLDDKAPGDRNMTDKGGNAEKDDGENITNLSLRLIASTVTSFLVLALLLFMVHRLRQRRLLLAMRRFENQSRQVHTDDTDSDPYIPNAFLSLECPPYTDPPPPYSPPKPPQILPGEQPPPYDEINHNVDEVNSDENRNQIRGVTSSSGTSRGGVGQRRTGQRNPAQVESNAANQIDHQQRSCQLEHPRSSSDTVRPPNSLPAYASTDVVEGLGVVISPGSDVVCYNAGWNSWLSARAGQDRQPIQAEATSHQRSPHRNNLSSSPGPNISRIQTMPTTTAFQRFSNIFRRDSWKIKNLRHQGRSVSDYSTPAHYATVPRNEQSPRSRVVSSHPQARAKNISRPYSNGFPDTLYLSYDAGQATYTLGAISPSTSSSNSSEHYDQNIVIITTAGSTTTSTTPSASSSGNSVSPPHGSCLMADDFLTNSAHRQQFHDDLCRHLPPLQLADVHEASNHDRGDNTYVSSPNSTSANSISNRPQRSSNIVTDINLQTFLQSLHPRETNFPDLRHVPSSQISPMASVSSFSSVVHSGGHQQQSLASFIRSNPSTSTFDGRDHPSGRASLQPLIISNCSVALPSTGDSTQVVNCISSQSCSNYFPALPLQAGVPIFTQGARTSRDPAAVMQGPRNSQDLTSTLENRTNLEMETRSIHMLARPQEFQIPCRSVSPFCDSFPSVSAAITSTTGSTSPTDNIPPANVICASASPSPSPPTAFSANPGILRRSQSGASQTSVFSVCSETGEKKLKPVDSGCPDQHSFSRLGPGYAQDHPPAMSLLSLADTLGTLSDNPIGYNESCDNRSQPIMGFHPLYSQNEMALSSEGCDSASGGLLPVRTYHSNNISSSTQPPTFCGGSVLPSSGDTLTCHPGGHGDGTSWNNSIYNFNSLAEVEKSVAVKDVPSLIEQDHMSQSVNVPPLPPFVTCQPGKTLKHSLPVHDEPNSIAKFGKSHEGQKKVRKKRVKDRSLSSPQFSNITKHVSSSPKHHGFKASEWNKETVSPQKSECAMKDKETMIRAPKLADKKHRVHSSTNRQHPRLSDSININKVMTRSAGDAPAVYGNADVYRSIGSEGLSTALTYQHQTFVPWNQQGVPGGCDHSFSVGTAINDLNQPPSYLKSQAENLSPSHAVGGSEGPLAGKGDQRKKTGHKRQSSAGERAGHTPSPSRYKSRPKSLAAPDSHLNEKREASSIRQPPTTVDFGLAGKGARSGFGHDLNFDDQSGVADLHIHEPDFGSRRVSIGQDNHTQSGPTRKLSRAEGNCEPGNLPGKFGGAVYSYHPGTRSGLSNELAFTSRSMLASGHKKRQSLPTGIGGASFSGIQDRASVCANIGTRPRQSDGGDCHMPVGQVRNERSAGQLERKVDKPVFLDDSIEATSYV